MNRALFECGEKVMLVSKMRPDLNGPCTVLKVFYPGDPVGMIGDVQLVAHNGRCTYRLSIEAPIERSGGLWCESALRKLPKPSSDSFTLMMSNLNRVPA